MAEEKVNTILDKTADDLCSDPLLDSVVRADEVRLIGSRDMTFAELFGGYDALRAITFSMETGFLDRVTELFAYSEVILGASYMARKNRSLHDAFYYAAVHSDLARDAVAKYPALAARIRDGSVKVKASDIVLDHRKRYILEGPSGTRVITSSANMSGKAWTGGHMENILYDDSREAFDQAMHEFDAAWACCADIPYVAGVEKDRDAVLDNPLIKNAIHVNNMAVLPNYDAGDGVERVRIVEYAMAADERYESLFKAMESEMKKAKIENGHYVISYKSLKKASDNLKQHVSRKRVLAERVVKGYPTMRFRYDADDPGMWISGEPVDLSFDEDAARRDGIKILQAFSHFEDGREFVGGDLEGLRDGHWRAMCYLFASPHVGMLKSRAYIYGMHPLSLPLYMILGSRGPDTGKTFMMELLIGAMTGKDNIRFTMGNTASANSDSFIGNMRTIQGIPGVAGVHEGVPYVYDELVSSTVRSVKSIIKEFDPACAREGTPVLVFTTNDLLDPDSLTRKRAIYIPFDAALGSGVNKTEFRSLGESMKRGFSGAFYREFTRRFIPHAVVLDDMICGDHPDGWYPDVVAGSSSVILGLFRDLGLEPYSYMRALTWDADYYGDNKNAEQALRMLRRMWDVDQEKFRLSRDVVRVYFGTDASGQKRAAGIANMLPAELRAKADTYKDEGSVLTFDRSEAEGHGLLFRRGFFDRFRR